MLNISQIYEGWKNKLIPAADMKEQIEAVSAERMEVCKGCPHYSENKKKQGFKIIRPDVHCVSCGCTLSAKTRCLSCSCPKNLWKAIMTDEQYDEIREEIQSNG